MMKSIHFKGGYRSFALAAAIATAVFISSCKKEVMQPAPSPAAVSTGTLYFHIHTNIGKTQADSGMVILDTATGQSFKLNIAQFYISGIKLKKTDGSFLSVDGVYLLKTIKQEEYLVANIPVGSYTSVSFDVGVDSLTNKRQPSSFPASSPLSQASSYNGGWFGGTFIFMNIQGYADTSASHSGKYAPFSYQTGTDPELEHVNMPILNFSISARQTQFVHIIADYAKLLQGVNFKTQAVSNPWNNLPLIQSIASKIPTMFSYE